MSRLSLYYPVKPFIINQHFGDNIPCVRDFGLPTQTLVNGKDNLTCPVGFGKLYGAFGMSGHNGIDLNAGVQNVFASCAGTVIEKQVVPARGLGLGILTDEPVDIDENGTYYMKIRYWHLKSFAVDVGQHVQVGTRLGVTNNTGYSSGNHLHFEGQPMVKDQGGHPGLAVVTGNIAGAIDLEPYFNGKFAEGAAMPYTPPFRHNFTKDLELSDRGDEVWFLQKALQLDGTFPLSIAPTGYFGNITRDSVKLFQVKYKITPVLGYVGVLTRTKLNQFFNT